jgi:hypothetical protein
MIFSFGLLLFLLPGASSLKLRGPDREKRSGQEDLASTFGAEGMTAAFAGKPSAERQLRGIRGNTSGKKTNQGVKEIKRD